MYRAVFSIRPERFSHTLIRRRLAHLKKNKSETYLCVCYYPCSDSRCLGDWARVDLRAFFATFVAAVFVVICAFYIATRGPLAGGAWTAEGLVTVILTATTVVLAALAIAIALVAIWGYDQIKAAAMAKAEQVATMTAMSVATKVSKETAEVVAAREVEARMGARDAEGQEDISAAFSREAGQE